MVNKQYELQDILVKVSLITIFHADLLLVTIQYPYEKLITSECFCNRIHFEFDKCIACEICVHVCPIDLLVDWEL